MTTRIARSPALIASGVLAFVVGSVEPTLAQEGVDADAIYVNGSVVMQGDFVREFAGLGVDFPVEVPNGWYWYDGVSGLWGMQGGPTVGQMPPELNLGGELAADASVGGTHAVRILSTGGAFARYRRS